MVLTEKFDSVLISHLLYKTHFCSPCKLLGSRLFLMLQIFTVHLSENAFHLAPLWVHVLHFRESFLYYFFVLSALSPAISFCSPYHWILNILKLFSDFLSFPCPFFVSLSFSSNFPERLFFYCRLVLVWVLGLLLLAFIFLILSLIFLI